MHSFGLVFLGVCVGLASASCTFQEWFTTARAGDVSGADICLRDTSFDREVRDEAGCTAIVIGSLNGRKEFVSHLIKAGVNVNAQCHSGMNALMYAARAGNLDLVKMLLREGYAQEQLKSGAGLVAAAYAARAGHFDVLKFLQRAPLSLEQLHQYWSGSPLMWAAGMADAEVLQNLLEQPGEVATLEHSDAVGNTAVIWAARFGKLRNLGELARVRANLKVTNQYGFSALMAAAVGGHVNAITFLLNRGLEVNAADNIDWTPIMYAALSNEPEAAATLLDHFASTQARAGGWNPLMIAAAAGNKQMVEFFLSRGISPFHSTDIGVTAEALARANGHTEIAEILGRVRSARDLHNLHLRPSSDREGSDL